MDISEKMKISQNRTINLLVQNNEDLDNKIYQDIKREKRYLDTIKLLNQFKHKIKFDGNEINNLNNQIIDYREKERINNQQIINLNKSLGNLNEGNKKNSLS